MRYRRDRTPGGCYFFTLVTEQRQPLLTHAENIERLREGFRREQKRRPFEVEAIVILPDHLHCLWKLPEGDADYSTRWAQVKRFFSIGCVGKLAETSVSRQSKRERPVWQRRFWEHRIRNDSDWRRHMDYIHYNPVKHGYAQTPLEWPHSSLCHCIQRGWYPEGWGNEPIVDPTPHLQFPKGVE